MKSIKKKAFTLLELFIVLFIIGIMGTFASIHSLKAIRKHRFENDTKKVLASIRFCQQMALSHRADIYLSIMQKGNQLLIEVGTDDTQGLFPNDQKMCYQMKNLYVTFNKEKISSKTFIFTSTGVVIPEGKIGFSNQHNSPKSYDLKELFYS